MTGFLTRTERARQGYARRVANARGPKGQAQAEVAWLVAELEWMARDRGRPAANGAWHALARAARTVRESHCR